MAPAKNAGSVRGAMLRDLRERKGLKDGRPLRQKDVAAALGVTEATYHRWESGGPISGGHLTRLARFYKVKATDLLQPPGEASAPVRVARAPSQLDRIEDAVVAIRYRLSELADALEAIQSSLARERDDAAPKRPRRRQAG